MASFIADIGVVTNVKLSPLLNIYKTAMSCIRLSHLIKGRIPEAKLKIAQDLEEYEKTLYYERMAFISCRTSQPKLNIKPKAENLFIVPP